MTDRESLRRTLITLLEADTGETYPELRDDVNLRDGLGLDSVDVVSLVSQIERQFRIRLSQQDLERLVTVQDLLDLVQSRLSGPGQAAAA